LFSIAVFKNQAISHECLYKEAIEGYKDRVPPQVYLEMSQLKINLAEWNIKAQSYQEAQKYIHQADDYYTKFTDAVLKAGEASFAMAYLKMSEMKFMLNSDSKITGFLEKTENYKKEGKDYFNKAIEIFLRRGKQDQVAKAYFDRAKTKVISSKNNQQIGNVEQADNDAKKAKKYFEKSMNHYISCIWIQLIEGAKQNNFAKECAAGYLNIGEIKYQLGLLNRERNSLEEAENNQKEADICFSKAIEILQQERDNTLLSQVYSHIYQIYGEWNHFYFQKGCVEKAGEYYNKRVNKIAEFRQLIYQPLQ
jgi:hypothetical protein